MGYAYHAALSKYLIIARTQRGVGARASAWAAHRWEAVTRVLSMDRMRRLRRESIDGAQQHGCHALCMHAHLFATYTDLSLLPRRFDSCILLTQFHSSAFPYLRLMAVPCSHPVHHSASTSTTSVWPSVTTMQDLRLVREAVHNSC